MDPLVFIEHDDVVYEHAPLTSVLSQIRFAPVLSLMGTAAVAGFQDLIRLEYPEYNRDQTAQIAFGDRRIDVQQAAPVHRFRAVDRAWTVSLAADFVALETTKYTDFDEFAERLSYVAAALHHAIRPGQSIRIGLRKTNEIRHPSPEPEAPVSRPGVADWRSVVESHLLGPASIQPSPAPLTKVLGNITYLDGDNLLEIRYGEAPENRHVFVLDQDYSTLVPHEISANEPLRVLLHRFSKGMTSFFHWALTTDFRDTLGPRARGGTVGRSG